MVRTLAIARRPSKLVLSHYEGAPPERDVAQVTDSLSRFDVVVLGGGPAGSAAAIELAKHGRRVVVLERSFYDDVRIGETIPPLAGQWLQRLGVRDVIGSVPHLPAAGVVRLWDSPVPLADPLTFANERHGWHVDRRRFDARLAEAAEMTGAVVHRGAAAVSCESLSDRAWRVQFNSRGRRGDVEATWLIDATGRRSWFLRRHGVRAAVLDRLVGLLGYGGPRTSGDDSDLFVEGTASGWWYSAPLPGERAVAAFMTDSDLIPRDGRGMKAFWEEQRSRSEFISRLHAPAASLRTVVARTVRSDSVAAEQWVAVGDAAMALDPLFGLGVCEALASGWRCARALLDAFAGETTAASKYQSWSESRYRDYLAQRGRIYAGVRRWPNSAFWQRRQSE